MAAAAVVYRCTKSEQSGNECMAAAERVHGGGSSGVPVHYALVRERVGRPCRLMVPRVLTASSSTCVPRMLFSVNSNEFPNELSTCVCAAKCITVSQGLPDTARYVIGCLHS